MLVAICERFKTKCSSLTCITDSVNTLSRLERKKEIFDLKGARCSSVVRAFAHGAMGRAICVVLYHMSDVI